jgi:site-specific recombinase XerD
MWSATSETKLPSGSKAGRFWKYARSIGLDRGYSAHSMRAPFITTALENGAQLEDVQKAAGHRDPSTTKLYGGDTIQRRR